MELQRQGFGSLHLQCQQGQCDPLQLRIPEHRARLNAKLTATMLGFGLDCPKHQKQKYS